MNTLPNSMTLGTHPCNSEVDGHGNATLAEVAEKLNITYKDVIRGFVKGKVYFGLTEVYVFARFHYSGADGAFHIDNILASVNGLKYNNDERHTISIFLEDELIEVYENECKKSPAVKFQKKLIDTTTF
jgi:hypothetical protein